MKLSEFLRHNQVTLTEFAVQIGTTTATVSRIVDGLVIPRRKLLLRIFEETGGVVTPNDLTRIPSSDHTPKTVETTKND